MTRLARGAAQLKWRRRRQEATRRRPVLNLVPLMDVFTILVFFFLVHSADSGSQALSDLVRLPESLADQPPRDTPVITITADNILLEGATIVSVDSVMRTAGSNIDELHSALQAQDLPEPAQDQAETVTQTVLQQAADGAQDTIPQSVSPQSVSPRSESAHSASREITIMGDRTIPYALLRKVLRTCTDAGYGDISLSVLQRSTGAG